MKNFRKHTVDIFFIIFASLIYSVGIHSFTVPNDIVPGGIVGLAIVINNFLPVSVGIIFAAINIPLVLVGFKFLGKNRMVKTLISVAVITAATDWLFAGVPVYSGDTILASIFGGVLFGAGTGMVFAREGTTGGIDIINGIIGKISPHLRMGGIIIATNAIIITLAMLTFRSIESGLYAVIAIFVSGKVTDLILYGSLEGKLLLIFSDDYEKIARKIIKTEGRGVTFLKGTGAFTGNEKNVICCAVHNNQYAKVKRIAREIDPSCFMIITNAREVFGEGFKENIEM
ncbi:MAG: YitT family protein [Defluviitaleaceae bacterium]|nr:YitT family protein [Defluviitaleaceae bacterium]